MENILLTSVLVFILGLLPTFATMVGIDNVGRPLVVSAIMGFILGDITTGIICGATIELIWLGVFAIGASNPPDMLSGAIIGTAYVIISDAPIETAVLLAVPVATLVKLVNEFRWTVINVILINKADKYADEGNSKKVELMYYISWTFGLLLKPFVVAVAFYLGIDAIEYVISAIPTFITDGLMYATGVIPAIGFALIARMIMTKKTALFLFLGFVLASFLDLSIIGIASLGCIIVAYMAFNEDKEIIMEVDDNEF